VLNRTLLASNKYTVVVDPTAQARVENRYTGQVVVSGLDPRAAAELATNMNLRALKSSLLIPTPAMMEAGGPGSASYWARMVSAL